MFRKRLSRAVALGVGTAFVVSVAAFANTSLDGSSDAIVVGDAATSAAAAELTCGGDAVNIQLDVTANNGNITATQIANGDGNVTAPTALSINSLGQLVASGTQTQSFAAGNYGGSPTNTQTLSFTIALSAAASAPAGAGSDDITFSESGAGMVNLASRVDLAVVAPVFVAPLVYWNVSCGPTYTTNGFFRPVDMDGVLNKAKAGQTIPLKFDIIDGNGDPVADRTDLVGITVRSITCLQAGTETDVIEEYSQSASGLRWDAAAQQYVFNFATQKTWATQCRTATLYLDGDEAAVAYFNFTK
jgi:hypothetical protein